MFEQGTVTSILLGTVTFATSILLGTVTFATGDSHLLLGTTYYWGLLLGTVTSKLLLGTVTSKLLLGTVTSKRESVALAIAIKPLVPAFVHSVHLPLGNRGSRGTRDRGTRE